jgi:uncharacterized repeat protein (TIGR01451 family)
MLKSRERLSSLVLAVLILIVATAFVIAQNRFKLRSAARPEINVKLVGSVERDSKLIPLDKSIAVNSGEIVEWVISGENSGNASALNYKTVGHIPNGTEFIVGTATADGAKTVFSIDGGKSYSPRPMIDEKQPDGSTKQVPAPVSMYTEIRYEWTDPLAQGGKLTASYKVRVK